MSTLVVPDVGLDLQGKQVLLIVPGGVNDDPDALVDMIHGPSVKTGKDQLVTELGGPVTSMYNQTKKVHWQGNYYGFGNEQNLQGSPIPDVNMNTRKLMYVYPVDGEGKPKPTDPDNGFRVFVMFDFVYWAEDPTNKLGCAAFTSSAPRVDTDVKVPLFRTPMQLLHNWPKRWQLILYTGILAFVMAVLCAAISHDWGKTGIIFVVSLIVGALVSFGSLVVTNMTFNSIKYCGFFDKPSCWTGLPDMAYENENDPAIYKWKSDAIRTFGGLPEVGASWGYQYRTRLLQYLIANGFCVVIPGFSNVKLSTLADPKALGALVPFKADCADWSWAPAFVDSAQPLNHWASQDNGCAGGWPGPDAAMLVALMSEMRDGKMFGLSADDGTNKSPHLNLNRLTIGGYSAGAQMTSRCINEFPVMKYTEKATGKDLPFPNIRAAFMLSGGTYQCYTGPNGWNNKSNPRCGQAPADCPIEPNMHPTPPSSEYAEIIGCCPANTIEARYSAGGTLSVLKHPPVVCAQTMNDSDADCSAHIVYTESLIAALKADPKVDPEKIIKGVKTVSTCWTSDKCNGRPIAPPRQVTITLDACSSHTWFPEMVVPVAQFLKDNTDDPLPPAAGFFAKK